MFIADITKRFANQKTQEKNSRWREVKDFSSQSFLSDTLQGKLSD